MAACITLTFERDVPAAELEALRDKIRRVLRGEAVPGVEVAGQSATGGCAIEVSGSRALIPPGMAPGR